jgi:hypothetical protein
MNAFAALPKVVYCQVRTSIQQLLRDETVKPLPEAAKGSDEKEPP